MNQPIYEQPQAMEPSAPAPAEPRYRLPEYGSAMQPTLRVAGFDPEIKLKQLKAEAQARNAEKKRQIDRTVSPIIQQDLEEATTHYRQLQSELERTRQALEQPFQRPQMDTYDMIAAGIAGLAGGAQGFNQAVGGAYQRMDQDYAQNWQAQRQNAQLDFQQAQSELEDSRRRIDSLKTAYINAVAREDDYERDLVLQQLKAEEERAQQAQDHLNKMEVLTYTQEQLNKRANLNDPRQREIAKRLAQTEEGAAALGELLGLDAQTIAALRAETPQSAQIRANTNLTNVKAEDIIATRPARLQKLDADIKRVIQSTATDKERQGQIAQKVAMYPDEFKLRAANVYSQIAKRERDGGGKAEKYPGEGSETTFRQMRDISAKVIAPLTTKMMNGEQLTPEEAQMYAHHSAELKRFQDLLDRTIKAKADYHTGKANGSSQKRGSAPRREIDTSGGFTPMKVSPGDVQRENPFAGAKARSGGKTRSGTSFTFQPD